MIWFALALFVLSFALTLLMPKPELEDARPNSLEDLNFPQANDGMPIALVLGTVRFKAPNTLWSGDFRSSAIEEKVKTGIFTSKTIIKGYKYYVGFDLGLCLGPDVHLRRVWLDKDEVWTGDVGPAETSFVIDKPNLFGGDDKGGGFVGTCRFYGGLFTQNMNAYLGTQVVDNLRYNGKAHIMFEQPYIGNQTSLKAPAFELEQFTDNLGLLLAERIITTVVTNGTPNGRDINPAEALYFVLTSDWGGRGVSTSDVDTASFKSAGETLAVEKLGISITLTKNSNGKKLMTEILRHIDGILFQHPSTGKIHLKLIRNDYILSNTPLFNEQSIAKVRKFSRTSWDETINQVRVKFQNRHHTDSPYADALAIDQDMANVNTQGKVKTSTISFPFCKEPTIAVDLATRERSQLGVPLYNIEIELNRIAAELLPGDVFRFSWAEYNLVEAVFRVQKFDIGSLDQGKVVLNAVQDTFAIATTVYAPPEDSLHNPIDFTAATIVDVGMQEAPYWVMQNQQELAIPPTAVSRGHVLALCRPVNGEQQGYTCKLTQDAFVNTVVGVDHLGYPPTAGLTANMLATDGFATGTITTVDVTLSGGDEHNFPTATAGQIRTEGRNLFFIGEELFAYESAADQGSGVWRLSNVHRALLDTEYLAHTLGDPVYFLSSIDSLALDEFDSTVTVTARFMSFTAQDESEFDDMANKTRTMNRRYERPLPADNLQVAGVRSTSQSIADVVAPFTIAWNERSRDDTSIRFETDATQTPEASQQYDVELWIDTGGGYVKIDESLNVTGTTTTVDSLGNTGAAYILITTEISGGLAGFKTSRYDFTVT